MTRSQSTPLSSQLLTMERLLEQADTTIATLRAENEELKRALTGMLNPIKTMQDELEAGCKLNGAMAVQIADSAQWYKTRAQKALAEIGKEKS